jgi:hypothetical protein
MITPSDTPSDPGLYSGVGVSAFDIQAGQQDAEITAAFGAANAVAGAGTLYPQGPRQAQTEALMQSKQGFAVGGYDIDAGYHGAEGDDGWPADIEPGDPMTYPVDD